MQKNFLKFISAMNAAVKRNQLEAKASPCVITKLLLCFLRDNGYINGFAEKQGKLVILLKYFGSRPVLKQIISVSKPGRRVYASVLVLNKLVKKISGNSYNQRLSFTIPVIFHKGLLYQPSSSQKFSKGGELLCLLVI
jgi:ribosomal protein S8